MGLQKIWRNYKVLIVMGTSLGLIHWGWYHLKSNPVLHKNREDYIPEPGIVAYVSPAAPSAKSKDQTK
uniref:PNAS-117 n=1 Tax=Cyprinodon variegatus TaxID=28743 RepID=A0A3Q2GMV7_CYPVA